MTALISRTLRIYVKNKNKNKKSQRKIVQRPAFGKMPGGY
jgi:hypothetical protein